MIERMFKDGITDASAGLFSGMLDVIVRGDRILEKKNPFSYSANIIVAKAGTVITIHNPNWTSFRLKNDVELTEANLDTGTFSVGKDYYIYLVDDGAEGTLIISANSTFPAGYSADNSRKLGGFHYGHIRKVSSDELWVPIDSEGTKFGSGAVSWKDNVTTGIVPNSVWDLVYRPKCSPEGMVKVGDIWVDIYLSSAAETISFENGTNGLHIASGRLQSKYGQAPVASNMDGLNWYNFTELSCRIFKRLLTYGEWIKAVYGNPQGENNNDNYGFTKIGNTARTRTGCRVNPSTGVYDPATGIKPAAISAFNIVDGVGNIPEYINMFSNTIVSTMNWYNSLGAGKGQAFICSEPSLYVYSVGGLFNGGDKAGSRSIIQDNYPWSVSYSIGARLACEKL